MKIATASLQMASSHLASQQREISESLHVWAGNRHPDHEGQARNLPPRVTGSVQISDAGRAAQSAHAGPPESREDADAVDPRLSLIKTLVEFLTGREIRLFDAAMLQAAASAEPPAGTEPNAAPSQPPTAQVAGYGVEYDYHESYSESEQTTFSANGTVHTADGRDIGFSVDLTMQRSYAEERNVSQRLGDAARKTDPLILNFAGTAAQLTDTRFSFDIDSNGLAEEINFVGPGSGFLAFDRNQDGVVNNGQELFGPASGDGFAELASLDSDRNGWIDENDPGFQNLRLWTKDSGGNDSLQSLPDAGVGALALTCVNTPFDIKGYANQTLGQIRSSGVFLQEDGKAGTIQQVDLTV